MPSLRHRSTEKELLDRDDLPFADIRRNMLELDVINTWLGGHAITLRGLRALWSKSPAQQNIQVVEIGCGGGDNLRAIQRWAAQEGIPVTLLGVDINEECIAFAQSRVENKGICFVCSDYRSVQMEEKPAVIFSSLFCHHFTDVELVAQLRWMKAHSTLGFFINDLHRHPLAFHSIRLLTRVFSKSYLVKNDAPLSVRRGFVRSDWRRLFEQAGITDYRLQWQWAFRWLITCKGAQT